MSTTSRGPSRRTLVKGAAWSVPVVAMGATTAAADVACSPNSCPPPPSVNWGMACASVGNARGCANTANTLQVPLTLSNTTDEAMIFVVEGAWSIANDTTVPPATIPMGGGAGFYGIGADPTACVGGVATASCPSIAPIASSSSKIEVGPGASVTVWYVFLPQGNASKFQGKIWYSWYDKATCTKVTETQSSVTSSAISPANCHSVANP